MSFKKFSCAANGCYCITTMMRELHQAQIHRKLLAEESHGRRVNGKRQGETRGYSKLDKKNF
jgi:hypothetical protein